MLKTNHMPINILFINSSESLFGAETRMVDIIHNLDRQLYRPMVVLPADGPLNRKLIEMRVETFLLDFKFNLTLRNIYKFVYLNYKLLQLFKEKKISIVHINLHYCTCNFWPTFLISKKPVICHLRGCGWINIFEKYVMSHYTKLICISDAVRKTLIQKRRSDFFIDIRIDRIIVLYDGVNSDKFSPTNKVNTIRKELGIKENAVLIALIGAIDKIKGQDIFLKAAKIILTNYPATVFLIVGDTYSNSLKQLLYKEKVYSLYNELGIKENVFFLNYRTDITDILNSIDLLVQPSSNEGLGTSMVEAMLCGKPVIGSDIGGIPEVIGNDEAGLVISERTPEKLAKAMLYFLDNPKMFKIKGEDARKRALKLFDANKNIKILENIYRELGQ